MSMPRNFVRPFVFSCLLAGAPAFGLAHETKIYTNQNYIEETQVVADFKIDNKMGVFFAVLNSLPDRVTVYPTENYYYFWFTYQGIKYAGNIRFDIADRDKGLVHFNYFKDFTDWQRDENGYSADLGAKEGVTVKAVGKLSYEVSYQNKRVRFDLNDLSGVKPPKTAIREGETYIGPVFDESGIKFFLLFNDSQKTFHFVLDETGPVADQFDTVKDADRITVGIRTGFAFYADRFADRRILVGVAQKNTAVNNYLDGPFDQLPDNFLEGDVLKKAILAASPDLEEEIDRFGNFPGGDRRYLIAPYLQYETVDDLSIISQCAADEELPVYYKCFDFTNSGPPDDGYDDENSDTENGDEDDMDSEPAPN